MTDLPDYAKMIDGKLCLTTAKTAEWLGVTRQAVEYWVNQGCPKIERGYYYLPDVLKWRGEGGDEDNIKTQKLIAEKDYRRAKATQEEIRLRELEGQYIHVDTAIADLQKALVALKKDLLRIPRAINIRITTAINPDAGIEAEAEADEVVRDALKQLGTTGKYRPRRK